MSEGEGHEDDFVEKSDEDPLESEGAVGGEEG